jgi:subtilase family serine protease
LTVVGQNGTSALPSNNAGWAQEIALDVEWAHAIAPGASIVLVEANSSSVANLAAAVKTAEGIPGVSVVSMSWGGSENSLVTNYDSVFTASGITFVAASGDDGAAGGAEWPASSPYVVGVGGTTLQVDASGNYQGETAWLGSSGGYSAVETEPSFQQTVQTSGMRSTPDVAFDGDPNTGVQVYSVDLFSGQGSWQTVAGTSLGAPAWAGLIAIADQGRALANQATLGSTQTLTALYSLPSTAFHTIGGGYNTQTGLGTPNGASLVNGLVAFDSSKASAGQSPSTIPPVTVPPVDNTPVISLPVITQPVSTPTPIIITTPVNTTPVTVVTVTTPPPAASPVSVLRHGKQKKVVIKHPKTTHKHVKKADVHSTSTSPGQASG